MTVFTRSTPLGLRDKVVDLGLLLCGRYVDDQGNLRSLLCLHFISWFPVKNCGPISWWCKIFGHHCYYGGVVYCDRCKAVQTSVGK